jgi:hypothetical protein
MRVGGNRADIDCYVDVEDLDRSDIFVVLTRTRSILARSIPAFFRANRALSWRSF